ncbi:cytochrome-c peroxidase [Advenella sp. RU8]|uniref:cytochrome-c peroxidase n=1 Tax=Advenella sp. RU8 TaxID=3399575 RepID=UPI003AAE4DED
MNKSDLPSVTLTVVFFALTAVWGGSAKAGSLVAADTAINCFQSSPAVTEKPLNDLVGSTVQGSINSNTTTGEGAQVAASGAGVWDAACLRQFYQGTPGQWPKPHIDDGIVWHEMQVVPEPVPPQTPEQQSLIELGSVLFHDKRLSSKGETACVSCHSSKHAFSDGRALAVGEDKMMGKRRSQTLYAAPFASLLFWDGRASSLEALIRDPVENPVEMNHKMEKAAQFVAGDPAYQVLTLAAFNHANITETEVAEALASFIRTIRPPKTLADKAFAGDTSQLSDRQLLGLHLFRTKARCMNCHNGALLTDYQFHNIGLSFYGRRNQDLGRFEFTRNKEDLGKFRTPSLRNIANAGPWMHNGLFPKLDGLIRLYNQGMGNTDRGDPNDEYAPLKSEHIKVLNLSADEMSALVEWLEVL